MCWWKSGCTSKSLHFLYICKEFLIICDLEMLGTSKKNTPNGAANFWCSPHGIPIHEKITKNKHKSNILDTTPLASFHEKPAFLYFLILVFGDPMNFATDLEVADLMARCPVAVLVKVRLPTFSHFLGGICRCHKNWHLPTPICPISVQIARFASSLMPPKVDNLMTPAFKGFLVTSY